VKISRKSGQGNSSLNQMRFLTPLLKNIINTKANRVTIHVGYFKMWSHQNTRKAKKQKHFNQICNNTDEIDPSNSE
jgi:hypothetical protein